MGWSFAVPLHAVCVVGVEASPADALGVEVAAAGCFRFDRLEPGSGPVESFTGLGLDVRRWESRALADGLADSARGERFSGRIHGGYPT